MRVLEFREGDRNVHLLQNQVTIPEPVGIESRVVPTGMSRGTLVAVIMGPIVGLCVCWEG